MTTKTLIAPPTAKKVPAVVTFGRGHVGTRDTGSGDAVTFGIDASGSGSVDHITRTRS